MVRTPQDGIGGIMGGEALALEGADFGRFRRRLVLAVLRHQGVACPLPFRERHELVRRVVEHQRRDAAPAVGALDAAGDAADAGKDA